MSLGARKELFAGPRIEEGRVRRVLTSYSVLLTRQRTYTVKEAYPHFDLMVDFYFL